MKKLCVLEQSGTREDPYTALKKSLFQTADCDFFRLNWKHTDDPDAFIHAPGALWSEGRSLLFDAVPKTYDYYMFIDDDIHFHHSMDQKLDRAIIGLLDEYQPLSASFYCEQLWGENPITEEMRTTKRAYPFLCLDLQLTIYSRQFAELVFPVPFHGSDRCMWYAFWLANKLNPGKQICYTEIKVTNDRSEPHANEAVREYRQALVKMFNLITRDKSFEWTVERCKQENNALFHQDPEKGSFDFNLDDVQQYCDWESVYIKHRSPQKNFFHQYVIDPQLRTML